MRKTDSNVLAFIGIVAVGVLAVTGLFIRSAVKAGRVNELLISSPILIFSYYLMYLDRYHLPLWTWLVPITVFSIYWLYLFSHKKVTNLEANPNWVNESWWWTLDGWQFEEEVASVFRCNGYEVEVTKKTGDGGVDLIMYKEGEKILVQCKHYKAPVGPVEMRALWGVKDDFQADKVIMVASSGVTDSSLNFIRNKAEFSVYKLEDIINMGLRPSCHTP